MATFQLQPGPVPLHHQVYLDLRAALDRGEWRSGDRLPTERELAARYGCSLITVRRALDELAREARIERTRGRGTFVTRPSIRLDMGGSLSFADEMADQGHLSPGRASSPRGTEAAALDGRGGPRHRARARRRCTSSASAWPTSEPLLLEQVHLPADRFPALLGADLEHASLYELLASRYGTPRGAVARDVRAGHPPGAARLACSARSPTGSPSSSRASPTPSDGIPVEYARSYRPGRPTALPRRTGDRPLEPAGRGGSASVRPGGQGVRTDRRRRTPMNLKLRALRGLAHRGDRRQRLRIRWRDDEPGDGRAEPGRVVRGRALERRRRRRRRASTRPR